jgi:acetyl-CoA acetyltransferase
MCGRSIRRLTADERAARDDLERERYAALYVEIEASARAEYEAQFSPAFQLRHPFKADGARIHAQVLERMESERHEIY